jgi:hypothetical protein
MMCMCANYNVYFANCILRLSLGTHIIGCVKGVVSGSHTRPVVTLLTASNQAIIIGEGTVVAEIRLRYDDVLYVDHSYT